jgi:DNA-binding response OmpR family regulator
VTPLPLFPVLACGTFANVRKRILVVEDDLELVELLKFNLTNAGFVVLAATDGARGLEQARTQAPDLILLDLMLPELDGLGICEILRRDRATHSMPIIILTALSSQLARAAGLDAGANDYITKPFKIKELLERMEPLLKPADGGRGSPAPLPARQ